MLLNLFRSFYAQNYPDDMEQCVEAFAVFGGLNRPLDLSLPLESLIETELLEHYGAFHNHISTLIPSDERYYRLLSAIAIGDRREHSAFRRAHIAPNRGHEALDFLRHSGILEMEFSREQPPEKAHPKQKLKREVARHRISHKMRFRTPFLRFWFYFIAPFHTRIIQGDFAPVLEQFTLQRQAFTGYIFESLCEYYMKTKLEDELVDSGSYWDRQVEIDLLITTKRGQIIVGECKWTNHKTNKKELHRLEEKCKKVGIEADDFWLFSKRGFSNEMTQLRTPHLKLFSANDLALLLENADHSAILEPLF